MGRRWIYKYKFRMTMEDDSIREEEYDAFSLEESFELAAIDFKDAEEIMLIGVRFSPRENPT
jgi:hypothetical protein